MAKKKDEEVDQSERVLGTAGVGDPANPGVRAEYDQAAPQVVVPGVVTPDANPTPQDENADKGEESK